MRNDKEFRYIPKYFHKDGNGNHLEVGKRYLIRGNGLEQRVVVIREFSNYYLVTNGKYEFTLHKLYGEYRIIKCL